MKYLIVLFLLFSFNFYGQTDVHIQNTIMTSLSERNTFFSNMTEVVLNVDPPRQRWICDSMSCIADSQIDVLLHEINIINAKISESKQSLGWISGRLLDEESKGPLLFASVGVYKEDKLVTGTETDLDGNYLITNLEPGFYDLEYSYVGYQTVKVYGLEVKLEKESVPSMHFYDSKTDEGLIGVNVLIYQDNKYLTGTSTDVNGKISLKELESGSYRFQFRYLGYESIDTLMQIVAMEEIKIPMRQRNVVLNEVVIVEYKMPFIFGCSSTQGSVETTCQLMDVGSKEKVDNRSSDLVGNQGLKIFPNPTSDYARLFVKEETRALLISNQEGRVICKIDEPAIGLLKIPVFDLPVGTYFVSLMTKNGMLNEKLVVVK